MACDTQNLSLYRGKDDVLCPDSWPTVSVDQGMERDLYAILYRMEQDSDYDSPTAVENIYVDLRFKLNDIDWTLVDAAKLFISDHHDLQPKFIIDGEPEGPDRYKFHLDDCVTAASGIFVLDVILYIDEKPVIARKGFLEVEPTSLSQSAGSTLSIADVRLAIRDNCPQANYLIDDYDFTNKEIFSAMRRTVDYWNETTPDIRRYSYSSFPYRFHWLQGTIGLLLKQAGTHKLRNHLNYSAGGVSVNEEQRWKDYFSIGDKYWSEYIHWVANKKYEINIEGSYVIGI